MTNAVIGYRNRLNDGFDPPSGGSWQTTLPLTNLLNRTLGRVARSTSAALVATTFSLLAASGQTPPVQMVALAGHNISPGGNVRIRYSTETFVVNQALKSEKLDDAAWTLSDVTVTANATAAPDGQTTADFVNEAAATNVHIARSNSVTKAGSAQSWSHSIYVKPNGRNYVKLKVAKNMLGGSYQEYVFDLVGGTIVSNANSGSEFTGFSAAITAAPNGFKRISVSGVWASTVTSFRVDLLLMSNSTTDNYLGVPGNGVYAWGLQIEQKAAPTSYYPSDATAGNRPSGYIDSWQTYDFDIVEAAHRGFTTADDLIGYTNTYIYTFASPVSARGWRFDIQNTGNPDGYVQLGRVFLGPMWSPTINMALGASLEWNDDSEVQTAISNAEYYLEKQPYRVARFTLPNMNEGEAWGTAFDIQRRVGVTKEVIFLWAGDDATFRRERSIYGRLRALSPIEYFNIDAHRTAWEVKELTA